MIILEHVLIPDRISLILMHGLELFHQTWKTFRLLHDFIEPYNEKGELNWKQFGSPSVGVTRLYRYLGCLQEPLYFKNFIP